MRRTAEAGFLSAVLTAAALLSAPTANAEPTPTPVSAPCREGAMFASGQGFHTCVHGMWVYRPCGPGTQAKQVGQDHVICDHTRRR